MGWGRSFTVESVVYEKGELHAFCDTPPDRWHLMRAMLYAEGTARWFRGRLGREEIR